MSFLLTIIVKFYTTKQNDLSLTNFSGGVKSLGFILNISFKCDY